MDYTFFSQDSTTTQAIENNTMSAISAEQVRNGIGTIILVGAILWFLEHIICNYLTCSPRNSVLPVYHDDTIRHTYTRYNFTNYLTTTAYTNPRPNSTEPRNASHVNLEIVQAGYGYVPYF
ncbi:MAG: hypothetical protein Tsb005_07640 [Gammaproteobacteria bacterium]